MNFRLLFLLFLLHIFSNSPCFAQQTADSILVQAISDGHCMGIAAGILKHGKIAWSHGEGLRDAENHLPFTPETPTRIASIAKPMTAIAILQLVEQGKIDLDVPIQTYLPDYPVKPEGTITTRQLLNHSAGLDGYKGKSENENKKVYPDLQSAVNIFKDRDLIASPGTKFYYTTYAYVLLGRIIEVVSGMSYPAYMHQYIWGPTGMTNTRIEPGSEITGQSKLYHSKGKDRISVVAPTNLSDRIPGGGIISTVGDLLRFGQAVMNNTLIGPETTKLMVTDPGLKESGNGYGMGWYLYGENPYYGIVFGHNGAQTGASTFLMILPEVSTVVVVLSNTSGALQTVTDITIALFVEADKL